MSNLKVSRFHYSKKKIKKKSGDTKEKLIFLEYKIYIQYNKISNKVMLGIVTLHKIKMQNQIKNMKLNEKR